MNIIYIYLPSLFCDLDIIRQPSEDEIIKLAPPPKKAWGQSSVLLIPWNFIMAAIITKQRPPPLPLYPQQ